MWPALHDITGVGLEIVSGRWDGMCIARVDSLVDTYAYEGTCGRLFSMGIRCACHRDRGLDFDRILGNRVAPNPFLGTRAVGRGANAEYLRIENPGCSVRGANLVGDPDQPDDLGAHAPLRDARRTIVMHHSCGIQAIPYPRLRLGHQ